MAFRRQERHVTAITDIDYLSDNSDEEFDVKVTDYAYADSITGKSAYLEYCMSCDPPLVPVSAFVDNIERTSVHLAHRGLRPRAATAVAECLKRNQCISALDLSDNFCMDDGAVALAAALRVNTVLTAVDLSTNQIGIDGGVALGGALRQSTTIKSLSLSNNKVGDSFAAAVGDWLRLSTSVTSLNLERCGMTGYGAQLLAGGVSGHPTLTDLNVSWNELCGPGGTAVFSALPESNLKTLSLAFTGLDDETGQVMVQSVAANTTLTALDVSHNNFTYRTAVMLALLLGGDAGVAKAAEASTEAGHTAKLVPARAGPADRPKKLPSAAATAAVSGGTGGKPKTKGRGAGAGAGAEQPEGIAPRAAVRASFFAPAVPDTTPAPPNLVAIRLAHNALSVVGVEILVRALVTNDTLSLLDLDHCTAGTGPGLWDLEDEKRRDVLLGRVIAARGTGKKGKKKGKSKGKKGGAASPDGAGVKLPPPVKVRPRATADDIGRVVAQVTSERSKLIKIVL